MIGQILPNNNEKCYRNFSPKIFGSKHARTTKSNTNKTINHRHLMSPLLIKSKQDRIDRIEAATISARIDRRETRERFESRKIREKSNTDGVAPPGRPGRPRRRLPPCAWPAARAPSQVFLACQTRPGVRPWSDLPRPRGRSPAQGAVQVAQVEAGAGSSKAMRAEAGVGSVGGHTRCGKQKLAWGGSARPRVEAGEGSVAEVTWVERSTWGRGRREAENPRGCRYL
jgi:hypothetical protein